MAQGIPSVREAAKHMPDVLTQLLAEEQKVRNGVSGMTIYTSNGSYTPRQQQQPQTPPQQQQLQQQPHDAYGPVMIDGKWTPRMLALLSSKPYSLSMHPDSHMNRIAHRAVKKFEKLRKLAGDEVAMLVAQQPEIVMLIEREEAKQHDGNVTTPKYTIASCAQSAAAVLLELEEAAAMSHLFAK